MDSSQRRLELRKHRKSRAVAERPSEQLRFEDEPAAEVFPIPSSSDRLRTSYRYLDMTH
jgi:hypothetical protein